MTRVVVSASAVAASEDSTIDEPSLFLAGQGVLAWGRLLANDGADFENGRGAYVPADYQR